MLMDTIRCEKENGVGIITFSRPQVRNAMSLEMIDEIDRVLEMWRGDDGVKMVVFTGEGDQAFMAGGDLNQFLSARDPQTAYPILRKAGDLLEKVGSYPVPTVAMINGIALGGGCEFAASCDFRFASVQAKMGFVQIGMHIITGWGGGSRLIRKMGGRKALPILLTGEVMDAHRAKEVGFIDHCYPHEQLKEKVMDFCKKITCHSKASIEGFTQLVRLYENGESLTSSVEREIEACSRLWGSDDHYHVVRRFIEKK